ncbi:MAG: NAD(P)-dependent oxidoreductase [Rhizobium sp.]
MSNCALPIMVTGASGFIGNHVARLIQASGRRVIGTDIARPANHGEQDFSFVQADVRDFPRHTAIVAAGCAGIIHCGGISGPMLGVDNPADVIDINVRGTVQLLELARIYGLRRFVGCSSVSAYGSQPGLESIDEQTPLGASTVYGSSKAAGDLLTQTYASQFNLSATTLRIGWVYGPGRRTDAILRPMIRSGYGAPPYQLANGADQMLQFVHVDDVAAAMIAAFEAPVLPRAAYNINGAEPLSLAAIAAIVRQSVPDAKIGLGPGPLPDTDRQGPMVLDAAADDFGWRPAVAFHEGVSRYADWLKENDY